LLSASKTLDLLSSNVDASSGKAEASWEILRARSLYRPAFIVEEHFESERYLVVPENVAVRLQAVEGSLQALER
jgi:hypothetical protein